jgi:glycosyltransferase involved in cell wall biosynthesis
VSCGDGIDASTTFLPFAPHQTLPLYYQACDVTVVPSNHLETFCMVALEAIACSCPLIVTDQVPEILRRFPTVPHVPPYDVAGLLDKLDAALSGHVQPADTAGIAEYDWSNVARRYVVVYRKALRPGTSHSSSEMHAT